MALAALVGAGAANAQSGASERALELLREGRLAEARPLLESLAAAQPNQASHHYYLGFCRLSLQDPDGAAEALRRAVALRPTEHAWLHALAKAELDRGRPVAAGAVLDRAISLAPLAEYRVARAIAWIAAGRPERAEDDLRAVLQERPRDATALYELGRLESDRGRSQQARSLFGRCVRVMPEHLECRFRLGLAAQRSGDADAARRAYERVLDAVGSHVGALYNLARLHRDAGRVEEAQAVFARFAVASELEDRIRFVGEFVRLDPGNADKHAELARLRLEAGRASEALDAARAAVQLAPEDAAAWALLARAARRLGRTEEAASAEAMAARGGAPPER